MAGRWRKGARAEIGFCMAYCGTLRGGQDLLSYLKVLVESGTFFTYVQHFKMNEVKTFLDYKYSDMSSTPVLTVTSHEM